MGRLIARRLAFMVFVIWGVTLVTFFLSRVVPGDPAKLLAGPKASSAEVAHIRSIYGLDQPLLVQYERYVRDLVHGNLGVSFVTRRQVTTDIATFLPATLELAGYALILGFAAALVVGTVAGYRRGTKFDAAGRLLADRRPVGAGVLARAPRAAAVPHEARLVPARRPARRRGSATAEAHGDPHARQRADAAHARVLQRALASGAPGIRARCRCVRIDDADRSDVAARGGR